MTYTGKLNPQPPTAQTGEDYSVSSEGLEDWRKRAKEAFQFSTDYIEANYRKQWEDSIRAFNNLHPSDSKFSQQSYQKRSHIYRPKIRTSIRKNEAAASAAYFSNMEVMDCRAVDESVKEEVASAEVMKQLIQYRLTKSINWFKFIMGAIQDAQVNAACAHIYWEYKQTETESEEEEEVSPEDEDEFPEQNKIPRDADAVEGEKKKVKTKHRKVTVDRPVVELFPIENLRIDPAADWMDPINTSPYLIHLIPVYVMDLKDKIEKGEWLDVTVAQVRRSMTQFMDSTRVARNKGKDDPESSDNRPNVSDYEIVWVQRHIHRKDGIDWEFYMLGEDTLLSVPKPLTDSVFHGKRPYVMGSALIETHKIIPASIPEISQGLATESNEIVNQRIDNVKFVLNKKWFAKRGAQVDLGGLVRNVPGGVVMVDDPEKDIREVNWPDVTSSAYEEQKRIDNDMNELLGNFSSSSLLMDRNLNAPAHNMSILNNSTGTLTEYLLRTFNETFVQEVLRQIVLLEQYYETDETIMAIAAKKAKLWQRFGMNEIQDELLQKEMTLTMNVGMGATDPQLKLQKFLVALNSFTQMMIKPVPGINMQEVGKEIFGYLGYNDPTRFFTMDNPQVAVLQQQLQQTMGALQHLQGQVKEKQTGHMVNLQKGRETNQTNLLKEALKQKHEDERNTVTHLRALKELDTHTRLEVYKHLSSLNKPEKPSKPDKSKKK